MFLKVILFSTVTGFVFAIMQERINMKKIDQRQKDQIKDSWWHDDF